MLRGQYLIAASALKDCLSARAEVAQIGLTNPIDPRVKSSTPAPPDLARDIDEDVPLSHLMFVCRKEVDDHVRGFRGCDHHILAVNDYNQVVDP